MVIDKNVISAEAARKIAEGCEAYAKSKGWHVSVWLLDETLTPLYFYRMQRTPMFTVKPALMKAEAAVRTGQPKDAYVQNATTRGPFVATVNAGKTVNWELFVCACCDVRRIAVQNAGNLDSGKFRLHHFVGGGLRIQ